MARLSPPLACRATTALVRMTAVVDVLAIEAIADVVGTTATADDAATLLDLTNTEEDELSWTAVDEDAAGELTFAAAEELLMADDVPRLELLLVDPLPEGMI